ncbi:MAG: hypothetical protein NTW19_21955 [Planctomycetota bacterium]|nr:hypothetical protein [Planctomycetota bacterium]
MTPAMAFILASWAALGVACMGLGLGLHRLLGQRGPSAAALLGATPLGLCVALLFLQFWHFFLPVTAAAFLALCLPALAGWTAAARDARAWLAFFRGRCATTIASAVLFAFTCVWLSNRALGPGEAFDSGLYHWNAIRWNNAFAVVPGLGNLHHRLAFNNGSLLLGAMLNTGPWDRMAGRLTHGFFLALLFMQAIPGLVSLRSARPSPSVIAAAMLLLPALLAAMAFDMAAPGTDLPVGVLVLLGCAALGNALLAAEGDAQRPIHLTHTAVFLAAAVCMKLSALPLALAAAPVWLVLVWPNARARETRRAAIGASLVATALLLSWAARGVVLSGYPCFPSGWLPAPVAWRVPSETAAEIRWSITEFARYQGGVESGHPPDAWDWVQPILNRMPWATTFYCLESTAALLALAWFLARRSAEPTQRLGPRALRAAWMALPLGAGLATWFLGAPDPRFAWHLFWIGPTVAGGALALGRWPRTILLVWSLPLLLATVASVSDWGPRLWQPPGRDHGYAPIPAPLGIVRATISPGVAIDLATDGLIWDRAIPSTSQVEPGARARDGADLSRGFLPGERGVDGR